MQSAHTIRLAPVHRARSSQHAQIHLKPPRQVAKVWQMATAEKQAPGSFREKLDEAKLIAKAAQLDEAERRLIDLEQRLQAREDRAITRHSELMTRIFTAMSTVVGLTVVAVTILATFSATKVREDTKDMEQTVKQEINQAEIKIDKESAELDKKFAALAGQALQKPLITITARNGLLDGQVFDMPINYYGFPILPLFLKNEGDKKTDPMSIYLLCSSPIFNQWVQSWDLIPSNDKDYPFSYYFHVSNSRFDYTLSPKETFTISGDFGPANPVTLSGTNLVNCKLLVFYGAERPAEGRFVLKR
jgi:hypothetical protein